MTRAVFSVLGAAAVLSTIAGGHALSEEFNTWRSNFGITAGKTGKASTGANQAVTIGASQTENSKRKGVMVRKETITIHGSPGMASKHKGEIEIHSFSGPTSSARGWPSKIEWSPTGSDGTSSKSRSLRAR